MNIDKQQTETYIITGLSDLDPVTVYVTNYKLGQGKMVIECFGDVWGCYWGAMGENTLQGFVLSASNDYLLGKLLRETEQTDFEAINDLAHKRGYPDIEVTSDIEIALCADDMAQCFGDDWMMDLPRCHTSDYHYLGRILNAVKSAFSNELVKQPSRS